MGTLIIYEIKKVFQAKIIWGVILGLLCLNLLLVYRDMSSPLDDWGTYSRINIAQFYKEHKGMSNQELLNALETDEELSENNPDGLYEVLYDQISSVDQYDAYLDQIQKEQARLSSSSLFSGSDSFSGRNVEKVTAVYDKLEKVSLTAASSYDIETVTDCSVTTYLLFAAILLLGLRIILAESENGLFSFIRPMKKGHLHTILAKEAAAALLLFFVMLVFYCSNYALGISLFGFSDPSRLIQSLDGYLSCPLQITAGQYLICFFAGQYFGYLAILMFLFFLGTLFKNTVFSGIFTVILFVSEEVLRQKIDFHSIYSLIRQINFAAGLDTASYFQNYRTMNCFGYPVSAAVCTWMSLAVFILLFGILACQKWCSLGALHRIPLCKKAVRMPSFTASASKEHALGNSRTDTRFFKYSIIHTNLFWHECYKLLFMNKGIVILLILCAVQIVSYKDYTVSYSEVDYYYDQYTETLEGDVYWKKALYLAKINKTWQEREAKAAEASALAESGEVSESYALYLMEAASVNDTEKAAYDMVSEQYNYLSSQSDSGKNVQYIGETGYRALFDDEAADVADAVKMIFVLLFGLCTMISCEKRTKMDIIILSCGNGSQRVKKCKSAAAICFAAAAWGLSFLPRIILTARQCELDHLTWSSPSLEWFSALPSFVPIWAALILLQLVRFCGGLIAAAFVLWMSSRTEHTVVTLIVSTVVLLLPALTWYLGMSGEWGLLSLASGGVLLL